MNFGGVEENVVTAKVSIEQSSRCVKERNIAVIGYGVQGQDSRSTYATMAST